MLPENWVSRVTASVIEAVVQVVLQYIYSSSYCHRSRNTGAIVYTVVWSYI